MGVTSAFRLWVLFGLGTITRGENQDTWSPVPFGCGSFSDECDAFADAGGELVTSAFRLWVLFGPADRLGNGSWMMMVTSAFRLWVLFGQDGRSKAMNKLIESPVPFGCGSFSDVNREIERLQKMEVTSAFRLWVLFGQNTNASTRKAITTVTSAFRLWVLFGPKPCPERA